jgi:beta-glucosidase
LPPWYDRQSNHYYLRDILDEFSRDVGATPDILHSWGWNWGPRRFGLYGPEQYADMGWLDGFRAALDDVQKSLKIPVSLYLDGTLCSTASPSCEGLSEELAMRAADGKIPRTFGSCRICHYTKKWQQYLAGVYLRVYRETGAPILYVDEVGSPNFMCWAPHHGHPVPLNMNEADYAHLKAICKATPEQVALYGEYPVTDVTSQLWDCNITYHLFRWAEQQLGPYYNRATQDSGLSEAQVAATRSAPGSGGDRGGVRCMIVAAGAKKLDAPGEHLLPSSRSTRFAESSSAADKSSGAAMQNRFTTTRVSAAVLVLALGSAAGLAQEPMSTGSARVDHLLSLMTLDEKITMLHGTGEDASTYQGEAGYLPGIQRLGIPPMRLADGPPGVLTRVPSIAPTSTMGLAATFSREDALANGTLIGREAKSHGVSVVLQPFINIDRDIEFSRGYNTFGEDPFLTGEMGAAEITGVQQEGIMAQAKHYVGYDSDGTDVFVDPQTLHEVYAAPFAAAVKAGVSSVMCSYNRINGRYACGNPDTLLGILKKENGFEGFVTSDWGATHATDFINSGLDMEMPGPLPVAWGDPSYFVNRNLPPAPKPEGPAIASFGLPEEPQPPKPEPETDLKKLLARGVVSEETITRAAGRVLLEMEKFGYLDGKAKLDVTPSDTAANAAIVERTAIHAAVLLKNEAGALPLKPADLESLALIGPGAGQTIAVGLTGEKAVGLAEREIGTVTAVRQLALSGAHIAYAAANDMDGTPVPASALSYGGAPGLERSGSTGNVVAIDKEVNFTLGAGTALPANTSFKWNGTLQVPESGTYRLHLQLMGCWGRLKIDDQMVVRTWYNWIHGEVTQSGQDNILPTSDGLDNIRAAVPLTAGPHRIYLEVAPDTSNNPVQVRLNWVTPEQLAENYRAAIAAARQARTAIVFAWSRGRPTFGLPGDQDQLIADVSAVNANTIVVLNVSQPVALPWLGRVKAVLQMWWPGDEGGWATAKLLLGKENPGGRLPFTWPRRLSDMPASDPAHPERSPQGVNGKTTFSEGILVGYRWFDRQKIEPLFPFGFGLSYTSFAYSDLETEQASDGGIDVHVRIKNTGSAAGDEVVQLYLNKPDQPPAGAQFADSVLAGFARLHLEPGRSTQIVLHVAPRQLEYWSTAGSRWMTAVGSRLLWVGGSSRDRRLESRFEVSR